jgi:cytochrome bd ubiquinol oxidase subunit II
MSHADWLALTYAALVAGSLLAYVLMDGWDLGVGIIYPLIARQQERVQLMRSIEPFWDANETWLVLGGMTLLLGFPSAYAALLTRLYVPACVMLLALVLRGVSYEFRYQGGSLQEFWGSLFAAGSILAAFAQGCMLGLVVEGAPEQNPTTLMLTVLRDTFPFVCGIGMVGGYAMLGACWLILKTTETLQTTAREVALPALLLTATLLIVVCLFTPFVSPYVASRWFTSRTGPLAALMAIALCSVLWKLRHSLWQANDRRPLQWAAALIVLSFIGIVASLFPYIVPYQYTLYAIANDRGALIFAGVGILAVLPVVVLYLLLGYRVFQGKITDSSMPAAAAPSIAFRRSSGHRSDLHMS